MYEYIYMSIQVRNRHGDIWLGGGFANSLPGPLRETDRETWEKLLAFASLGYRECDSRDYDSAWLRVTIIFVSHVHWVKQSESTHLWLGEYLKEKYHFPELELNMMLIDASVQVWCHRHYPVVTLQRVAQ